MENRLNNLSEFQDILAHYHIAEAGKKPLNESRLILLVGPSATGRDTTIQKLVETGHYYHVVSDTTRKPRENNGVMEQNGVEYWFRAEQEFLNDLKAGRLLEAEVIHGQHISGISIRELERANQAQKIAITNVELNIKTIVAAKPDTVAVLMLPPSFEEWMRRLDGRGKLPDAEKKRRMETALRIFEAGLSWPIFTFVINDSISQTVEQIERLQTKRPSQDQTMQSKQLVAELLSETQTWLTNH